MRLVAVFGGVYEPQRLWNVDEGDVSAEEVNGVVGVYFRATSNRTEQTTGWFSCVVNKSYEKKKSGAGGWKSRRGGRSVK